MCLITIFFATSSCFLSVMFAGPSTLSSSLSAWDKSDIIANPHVFTLLCLIKISQRNGVFRLLPLMELLRWNNVNQLLTNNIYLIESLGRTSSTHCACVLLHSFLSNSFSCLVSPLFFSLEY